MNRSRKIGFISGIIGFIGALVLFDGEFGPAFTFACAIGIVAYANSYRAPSRIKKKYAFIKKESTFTNSLLLIIAVAINLDGKKTDSEMRYIEKAFLNHFSAKITAKHLARIQEILKKDPLPLNRIFFLIRNDFRIASKVQLMHLLIGICTADGLMSKKENAWLKDVAIEIRLPFNTYKSMLNMFHFKHEGEQEKRKKTVYSSQSRLKYAFGILELEETATEVQIKKAYRKLAVLHHPDKVAHLGEELEKSANDKFLLISDAYTLIKEQKGFN